MRILLDVERRNLLRAAEKDCAMLEIVPATRKFQVVRARARGTALCARMWHSTVHYILADASVPVPGEHAVSGVR